MMKQLAWTLSLFCFALFIWACSNTSYAPPPEYRDNLLYAALVPEKKAEIRAFPKKIKDQLKYHLVYENERFLDTLTFFESFQPGWDKRYRIESYFESGAQVTGVLRIPPKIKLMPLKETSLPDTLQVAGQKVAFRQRWRVDSLPQQAFPVVFYLADSAVFADGQGSQNRYYLDTLAGSSTVESYSLRSVGDSLRLIYMSYSDYRLRRDIALYQNRASGQQGGALAYLPAQYSNIPDGGGIISWYHPLALSMR